jgi:hypothetical protein
MPGVLSTFGRSRPTWFLPQTGRRCCLREANPSRWGIVVVDTIRSKVNWAEEITVATLAVICIDRREKGVLDSRPPAGTPLPEREELRRRLVAGAQEAGC